jgi:hypothetical protein
MSGWIGVDLDGTLAVYNGWMGPEHIGEPIPAMADRVREWLEQGRDVRIFTARASGPRSGLESQLVLASIDEWCKKHFGRTLPVTCTKDYGMIELWDDRAVQVEPNTGRRMDGLA